MAERVQMPRWGWGDPAHERSLSPDARQALDERLGLPQRSLVPAADDQFVHSETRLVATQLDALVRCVGAGGVKVDFISRLQHSAGKSYPDLVRMWNGGTVDVTDAVVQPADADAVAAILDCCRANSIAVVPFGGGTSVVGGLDALTGEHSAVITLDLGRLEGLVELDTESRIATFAAGSTGPRCEQLLLAAGLTIGHFPQSFEFATIGGFAATRSAGQASTGYGRFDANVLGLRLIAPSGRIDLDPMPGTAAGPGLRDLMVGSEGIFGVISDVSVQLSPLPEVVEDRAWFFESFDQGCEALRAMEQEGVAADVTRLSDESETAISLLMSGGGTSVNLLRRYLSFRGVGSGCLAILGFEGTSKDVGARLAASSAITRARGGVAIGSPVARAWRKGRFAGPYLRDVLMAENLMVDTLETATTWSNLRRLHREVSETLSTRLGAFGGQPIVMCHVSHLYRGGASLYFTWIGRQPGTGSEQQIDAWQGVKQAAGDSIRKAGGTITHHHAIGTDHARWLPGEITVTGMDALRAVKDELDPTGIMNPGKVL